MKKTMVAALVILTGCASPVTPEMRDKADERKGQQHRVEVNLEPSDHFSRTCGSSKPYESIACSQKILERKIILEARDKCVFFGPYQTQWKVEQSAYPRTVRGTTTITCIGSARTNRN